jgi:single-strand DNA-binding protein
LAQKYLHKGSLVYIEGRLRTRNWDDKEGHRKFATEVVGDNLIMLDKRTDGTTHTDSSHSENLGSHEAPPADTDVSQDLPY